MDVNEASICSSTLSLDLSDKTIKSSKKQLPSQDVETKMVENDMFHAVFLETSAKVRAPKALKLGLRRGLLWEGREGIGRNYDEKNPCEREDSQFELYV